MKRKYIGIALVACTIALSLSVVSVLASPAWTIDDLLYFFEHGDGRRWLQRTNSRVFKILEKMGQGLVGEYHPYLREQNLPAGETVFFEYTPPHPKKFTLWIETDITPAGEWVIVRTYYDADGYGTLDLFRTNYCYGDPSKAYLVLDQVPIAAEIRVTVEPSNPGVTDVDGSVIIEEV